MSKSEIIFDEIMPALAGAIFLHPDFGIDKTNQLYRKVHKWFAIIVIA